MSEFELPVGYSLMIRTSVSPYHYLGSVARSCTHFISAQCVINAYASLLCFVCLSPSHIQRAEQGPIIANCNLQDDNTHLLQVMPTNVQTIGQYEHQFQKLFRRCYLVRIWGRVRFRIVPGHIPWFILHTCTVCTLTLVKFNKTVPTGLITSSKTIDGHYNS